MVFIKTIMLILVFIITTVLGLAMANRYKNRVKDLREMRNIFNILETKIKYTYEPLPQIFSEIFKQFNNNIGSIFEVSKDKMKELSAGEAWHYAIENSNTNMNDEDLSLLKNFEKMLRKN